MNDLKKHLPNALTCLNVFCGSVAIPYALERNWQVVFVLVSLALIADFLDGFVARLLGVSSPIGRELDSLADVITFGVLPGMVMFRLMGDAACSGKCTGLLNPTIYPYMAFLIPIFSALRLAKFNIDTRQTDHFRGLPTPANAIFFVSIPFLMEQFDLHPKVLLGLVFVFSYLLVSDFQLIALKFKSKSLKDNWDKLVLFLIGVVFLVFMTKTAFCYIIPIYIAFSFVYYSFFYVSKD
jgi:CDP-diacylglycerol--serine O-phosphatidyltransferase